MVVIVDYGMGNLRSVEKAIVHLGGRAKVTAAKSIIKKAKKIFFPGVGNFGQAVKELKRRGIFNLLREKIKEGVPFLGICLGMHLLLEESEEAPEEEGLGVIKGKVIRFSSKLISPHMGWNKVKLKTKNQGPKVNPVEGQSRTTKDLFRGVKDNSYFYFAHSYYCRPRKTLFFLLQIMVKSLLLLYTEEIFGLFSFIPRKASLAA